MVKHLIAGMATVLISFSICLPCPGQSLTDVDRAYRRGDFNGARRTLLKLAGSGNVEAQFFLGTCYELGRLVPRDYGRAMAWYRRSAWRGHALAAGAVGMMYYLGRAVKHDLVQAYAWFCLAGELGDKTNRRLCSTVAAKMPPQQWAKVKRLVADLKGKIKK